MDKPEKQIRKIKISPDLDAVKIIFAVLNPEGSSSKDDDNDEVEEGLSIKPQKYTVESPNVPHKDFQNAIKKLRKFALEVNEITIDSKEINTWTVSEINITGDYLMKQSRVVMKLSHYVKSTKKNIPMATPQITMYPQNDDAVKYYNASKMTEAIEEVVKEAWLYLGGKYEEKGQLPLFPGIALKVA